MLKLKQPFAFGTKAENLDRLQHLLKKSIIPPVYYFDIGSWSDKDSVVKEIQNRFPNQRVIVRSSAASEDGEHAAMAGVYQSIQNISSADKDALEQTIIKVMESYEETVSGLRDYNQVLIQEMVDNVSMSGVVFTQDMKTGAPYYVVNYDDQSGRTDTVTAGTKYSNRTLLIHRNAVEDLRSERFQALLSAVQEIEQITQRSSLDIEYAVGWENQVYIFQVRQITTLPNWNRGITVKVNDAIERMRIFVEANMRPQSGIYGSRVIYGQMPDWNPVEMIGSAPRPLASSLYRYLITNFAWREARRLMGYAEPKGCPLMVSFAGRPYIDVRLSFHSYLPAELSPSVAHKLTDAWLDRLQEFPVLHDKVEFDVAVTALTFDFDSRMHKQCADILDQNEMSEFRAALFSLTNNLISSRVASIEDQLNKIATLQQKRALLLDRNDDVNMLTASALLEDCIRFGTIPFSILARHAFIAKSFLLSLIERGVMDENQVEKLQKSIKTIASEFVQDLWSMRTKKNSKDDFLGKYGHLRPGTYDILSLRYDQREDMLAESGETMPCDSEEVAVFSVSSELNRDVTSLLEETGFSINSDTLFEYIRQSIAGREYAKFLFTRNISDTLEIIAHIGEQWGMSREELSYLKIEDILESSSIVQGRTLEHDLREKSNKGREDHELSLALHLPHLIISPADVSVVPLMLSRPNFVTQKTIREAYCFIDGHNIEVPDISRKIVLIESADPGFDWIFSYPLAGLITKHGGANSHMAIRCTEFGLPAAIGVGEQIFDRILRSRIIELNCSEGMIISVEV